VALRDAAAAPCRLLVVRIIDRSIAIEHCFDFIEFLFFRVCPSSRSDDRSLDEVVSYCTNVIASLQPVSDELIVYPHLWSQLRF
jgi:hypothetical protein